MRSSPVNVAHLMYVLQRSQHTQQDVGNCVLTQTVSKMCTDQVSC